MTKPLTDREEKGQFGEDYVTQIIRTGWRAFVQKLEGRNDRGIDLVVQDATPNHLTGLQFNVQVKTSDFNVRLPGESFPAPVDREHLDMWRACNVPVVLVCVDEGPPPVAYWRLITPGDGVRGIRVFRRNVFGPASRDAVVAAIRRTGPQALAPVRGEILDYPLNKGVRNAAKDYYRQLMRIPFSNSSIGPIEFTWKGWRHMTRQGRSMWKIRSSLLLLPSVRNILDGAIYPKKFRSLDPLARGNKILHRTLLVFERITTFDHRVPTWLQVVIEAQAVIPTDWALTLPNDPRRELRYKFLNLSELARPVT